MVELDERQADTTPRHVKLARQHFEKGYVLQVWDNGARACFSKATGHSTVPISARMARLILRDMTLVCTETPRYARYVPEPPPVEPPPRKKNPVRPVDAGAPAVRPKQARQPKRPPLWIHDDALKKDSIPPMLEESNTSVLGKLSRFLIHFRF